MAGEDLSSVSICPIQTHVHEGLLFTSMSDISHNPHVFQPKLDHLFVKEGVATKLGWSRPRMLIRLGALLVRIDVFFNISQTHRFD